MLGPFASSNCWHAFSAHPWTSSFCCQTKRHDDRLEGSDKPFACFQRSDPTSAQVELRVSAWVMKTPTDPIKTSHPIHLELPGKASLHHIGTACHLFGVFAVEWAIEKATNPHPGSELEETDTALNLHFHHVRSPEALQWCQHLWFSHWAWGLCVGCNVVQDPVLSSWSSQHKGSWTKQWYYLAPGAAASLRYVTVEDLADKLGRHQKAKNLLELVRLTKVSKYFFCPAEAPRNWTKDRQVERKYFWFW